MERTVLCMDANVFMEDDNIEHKAIITSLPDMAELDFELELWEAWIRATCELLMENIADDGVIFFYQTNRKLDGRVIDKKYLISSVFLENGFREVLAKIVLKQKPETVNFFRPTYTNLFAFSKKLKAGKPTPDVIHAGKMLYKNAMGFDAVELCLDYIANKVDTNRIFDPFCGMGSVLKLANERGFDSLGIDIDKKQCEYAKNL